MHKEEMCPLISSTQWLCEMVFCHIHPSGEESDLEREEGDYIIPEPVTTNVELLNPETTLSSQELPEHQDPKPEDPLESASTLHP